ncbi:hypothetical protein [Pseudoalteromonas rubra]|uniref:Uncharacterized protein n=1 Tax=Pseudoalteromonas rubra TaxID=43658 RepID=A0A0U3GRK6_9GAMM|nr:hypothetical protein [Pseudoalteromonas rubra]ALU45659.1 hypothetical protein AT705_22230 [Pseudoalteromonas rubra]
MQTNSTTLSPVMNSDAAVSDFIHKIISCEKVTELATMHCELSHGLFASLNGGADVSDVLPLLERLVDQSEEIASLLNQRKAFEAEQLVSGSGILVCGD